jgi:hypothetical protein
LSEARRLADAASVSQEVDRAEALRKWLLDTWDQPEVMARDVVQYGPNVLRETKKASAALTLLEQHSWVTRLAPGTEVRGAPRKQAWAITKGASHVV